VKCDETKPECERCTTTGRKCDGYLTQPHKQTVPPVEADVEELPVYRSISWEQGSSAERRAIDFFRHRTAPNVSGHFDTDFVSARNSVIVKYSYRRLLTYNFDTQWTSLVLQISQSEPAVRHALAAVGTLNECRDIHVKDLMVQLRPQWTSLAKQVTDGEPAARYAMIAVGAFEKRRDFQARGTPCGASITSMTGRNVETSIRKEQEHHNDPFALSQYNKSITHLTRAMSSSSSNSVDTALLVCILFVCVECLRGDYEPALKHFRGGMSIALAAAGTQGPNSRGHQTTAIRERILPFFNRLELLGQVYGTQPTYAYGLEPSEVLPQTFHSIVQARDSIVHLMNLSIRLIHSNRSRRYTNQISASDRLHHTDLITSLQTWKSKLDTYLLSTPPSPRLTEAATILQIQHLATLTWLNRSLVPEECAADADIPLYERAVSLAETLPSTSSNLGVVAQNFQPSTFLFDMETVSPLYLIAIKCRHPLIRRRAIAVLRRRVRREGLWDSGKAAAIAERIVELEEAELEVLDGSVLPREEVRVRNCRIDSGPGLNDLSASGHRVTFFTMPEGVGGRWRTWEEWLELRP